KPAQVVAAVRLLDEGATVPFIARYRKEVTGSLDDSQLRLLETRLHYLRELEERRETILASILEQGQLTPELKAAIQAAETKTLLEDLYLPYKPKRRTKAQIAKEAGLEPLALGLLAQPESVPAVSARAYLNPEQGFGEVDQVLEGARQILMERFCENATTVSGLREKIWDQGFLMAKVRDGKEIPGAKFRDYFEYEEALTKIPSHRLLALYRGRNEDVLDLTLKPGRDEAAAHALAKGFIQEQEGIRFEGRPADEWLIVSAQEISVLARSTDNSIEPTAKVLRSIPWQDVKSVRTQSGVGSGTLQVRVGDDWIDLVRFSNAYATRFHKISRLMEKMREFPETWADDLYTESQDPHSSSHGFDAPQCPDCS
ncbi:MAG: hypothetical protein EBY15_13875, partial [Gammaproteobacteria bacterium]|nr:hypothetical protein [Gammaproteobacteria bacterium]